ncbi:M14 family zinc carboxypeptidase [Streptomyces sp. NPDC059271]|uniref:M14 family zinc carboxypeptidase n=1 Tax=Streptomyces sp. NPDC059271 TaxID=3346799 RepID=UPI00367D48E6
MSVDPLTGDRMHVAPAAAPHWPLPPDLMTLCSSVPHVTAFPTVAEINNRLAALAERHPSVATLRRIGTSRGGEPLMRLDIDGGPRTALVVGGPHPNEPIGSITALHLAESLCADPALRRRLGHSWHIIGCIDPDGAKLNYSWFDRPHDRIAYFRGFYRPAFFDQIEWTFPLDHRGMSFEATLPEVHAWMESIDELRPDLMPSLHNSDTGGVFYYLSRNTSDLPRRLSALPPLFGLTLDVGEPESPGAPLYAPAVFGQWDTPEEIDYLIEHGKAPDSWSAGDSSFSYARKYATTGLIAEVPMWSDATFSDTSPSTIPLDALREQEHAATQHTLQILGDVYAEAADHIDPGSAFARACRDRLTSKPSVLPPTTGRLATRAEVASQAQSRHLLRLRYGSMLVRLLASYPALLPLHAQMTRTYQQWERESVADTPPTVPVHVAAGIQLAAITTAATC